MFIFVNILMFFYYNLAFDNSLKFVKLLFLFAIAKLQKVCRCALSMRKTRFAIR